MRKRNCDFFVWDFLRRAVGNFNLFKFSFWIIEAPSLKIGHDWIFSVLDEGSFKNDIEKRQI